MASDEYLMRRVQERDARAFEELLQRHAPRLRRRLAGMVRDEAAAEDLLQEASLRLWTRADQWRGEGSAKGWLLRTATNLALSASRHWGAVSGKHSPMSPAARAPRMASVSACSTASPSLCPASPHRCSMRIPPSTSAPAASKRCES